ncbi:MAG: hemerythrin family protein [Gammaproteobacteria bacterium]|nr:hemerythrin family protein [Gammaproteobacteria bacterium]MDH5302762.1 hemerythrin family protein [Gammaproteobacteria bacterium]MDH5321306.1 hemerythrin family protein [Gammaproteobacteria bacterium]
MSLIKWKEEFSVGVLEVDYEHQALIELINNLHAAVMEGVTREQVVAGLGEIYAHIAAHFALEEKVMQESHYPSFSDHKIDHETLLDDLRDIMDEVEDDGEFNEPQLATDLDRWFSEHFRTHDAKLHKTFRH